MSLTELGLLLNMQRNAEAILRLALLAATVLRMTSQPLSMVN